VRDRLPGQGTCEKHGNEPGRGGLQKMHRLPHLRLCVPFRSDAFRSHRPQSNKMRPLRRRSRNASASAMCRQSVSSMPLTWACRKGGRQRTAPAGGEPGFGPWRRHHEDHCGISQPAECRENGRQQNRHTRISPAARWTTWFTNWAQNTEKRLRSFFSTNPPAGHDLCCGAQQTGMGSQGSNGQSPAGRGPCNHHDAGCGRIGIGD